MIKVDRRIVCALRFAVAVPLALTALVAVGNEEANTNPPEGFVSLFNGRDLSGWKGLVKDPPARAKLNDAELAQEQQGADKFMQSHWTVRDGEIHFNGKGENLCTANDYTNFVLFVDYLIEPSGDSGIYLRGTPQVQIWDPKLNNIGSGGLYNNKHHADKPLVLADAPVGQWNTLKIEMVDDTVSVWLNGQLVVDKTVMENYWEPEKPIYASGAIELQNHSTPLRFRNIFVKELP